jgi:ribosomal protein S18 acetylase RimI-like enzyme
VTKRANSALPPLDTRRQESGLAAAIEFYRRRRLPVMVQLPEAAEFTRLDLELEKRGYRVADPTLVLEKRFESAAPREACPGDPDRNHRADVSVAVTVSNTVEPEWFGLWWSVDGRSGDAAARAAQAILTATPSRYLAVRGSSADGNAILGVARLTPTPRFGALACVAVSAGQRERGLGRLLLDAAATETRRLGLDALQLQVIAANPAIGWYERAGFRRVSGYHYRVEPTDAGNAVARTRP